MREHILTVDKLVKRKKVLVNSELESCKSYSFLVFFCVLVMVSSIWPIGFKLGANQKSIKSNNYTLSLILWLLFGLFGRRMLRTKLFFTRRIKISSAYHPQSNGQIKAVNKIVEMCLCCFTGDHPTQYAYIQSIILL